VYAGSGRSTPTRPSGSPPRGFATEAEAYEDVEQVREQLAKATIVGES
jgi:hypothetical protein